MSQVDKGTAKVLVIGPTESGKSTIADFVAEVVDHLGRDGYEPTIGVRILEFSTSDGLPVELWDASGDRRFESGWTAIQKDAVGVIIVFNGDDSEHERSVSRWHEWFVKSQGLDDSQCLIMSHTSGIQPSRSTFSDDLRRVRMVCTSYEAPQVVKREVDTFVSSLRSHLSSRK